MLASFWHQRFVEEIRDVISQCTSLVPESRLSASGLVIVSTSIL